jgi:23S rRNA (cytosine1962-C5)-methyltransferase
MKKLYLKPNKDESLQRFHPWLFSGAIATVDKDVREGDIVEVYSHDRRFLAIGHYQPESSIALRVLAFEQTLIDGCFWDERLKAALSLRRSLGLIKPGFNDTYRLVHGEGDNLPGLIIDIYGSTAVIQAHSAGMHLARKDIATALKLIYGDSLSQIFYKSEGALPFKAALDEENEYLYRSSDSFTQSNFISNSTNSENIASNNIVAASSHPYENGLRFIIDWQRGQKTGFFIDQRDNRNLLSFYAHDRNVLNMFCYTGAFSVYALHGGARTVHSVDSSAKAITLANANVNLNFPDCQRHKSFSEDAFRFLENIDRNYDLIILDPPAFAKRRNAIKNALRGYQKLNAAAIAKIASGGILFTFSCSQAITKQDFRLAVFSAAAQTGRRVRILHQLAQPADHPINIYHPEGEYLKGLVLRIE